MASGDETVREVCAEIGDWDAEVAKDHPIARPNEVLGQTIAKLRWWRDRILAAHEREMTAKDAEVARLVTECNRLESALKPVMDACAEDAKCDAVREAQRIMKEGEVK